MSQEKARKPKPKQGRRRSRSHAPADGSVTTRRSCPPWPKSSAANNSLSLPRLQKIVVNMGVGKAITEKKFMEEAVEALKRSPARSRS